MKLYLIRHAESANNVLYDGTDDSDARYPDPEITDIGHQQGRRLAEFLAHPESEPRQHPFRDGDDRAFGFTHLYCSLMTRSILTAQYIADACNLRLEAHPELFELGGIYEMDDSGARVGLPGPNRAYFEDRFPELELPDSLGEQGWWNRPAETDELFVQRTRTALQNVIDQHAESEHCVGLVVHGDFIDQAINELMGVERRRDNYRTDWVANWACHNTSISRIDVHAGSRTVVYLNRLDHLPVELISW